MFHGRATGRYVAWRSGVNSSRDDGVNRCNRVDKPTVLPHPQLTKTKSAWHTKREYDLTTFLRRRRDPGRIRNQFNCPSVRLVTYRPLANYSKRPLWPRVLRRCPSAATRIRYASLRATRFSTCENSKLSRHAAADSSARRSATARHRRAAHNGRPATTPKSKRQ